MRIIDGIITIPSTFRFGHVTKLVGLDSRNSGQSFPPVDLALKEPNGLLAVGGGLETDRLLNAYRHGIFPWYEAGQPILWWSPDPRAILIPGEFKMHRSLRKSLRHYDLHVTFDEDFAAVIAACAAPRRIGMGTWITPEMQQAYIRLYKLGYAHSVEVWNSAGELIGGLYGLAIGKVFFGESMFSRARDASKVALATLTCQLQAWDFALIDCQQETAHLSSLGARPISRDLFVRFLSEYCAYPLSPGRWVIDRALKVDAWQP